ncbi:MAG: hypothetical protein ACOY90_02235 [Candidatus Zhuqueibacterota bacterium]
MNIAQKFFALLVTGAMVVSMQPQTALAQTQKTVPPDSSKIVPSKEKIELPDVLIYGTDKSARTPGDKIDSRQDDVKLIPPTENYQPVSNAQDFANQKVSFNQADGRASSRTMVQIDYGRFQQFDALAGYWQELDKINTSFSGRYSRSNGQFGNSQYFIGLVDGQFGGYLSDQFFMTARGHLYTSDYGMYNVALHDLKRNVSNKKFDFDSHWNISAEQAIEFGLSLHLNNFEDADTANYRSELSERNVGLSAAYTTKIRATRVHFNGLYQYNKINTADDPDLSNSQKYIALKTWVLQPWGKFVVIRPGLTLENIDLSNGFSETLLSPEVEVIYTPIQTFGIRLSAGREYSPLVFSQQWKTNPFISHAFDFIPAKKDLELKASMEYRPTNAITFMAEAAYQDWAHYAFWHRDVSTGLISLSDMNSVDLTSLTVKSKMNLSPDILFDVGLQWLYGVPGDSSASSVDHIPYLERYKIPVNLGYQITKMTSAKLGFQWIGPRYYALNSTDTLAGYGLLSLLVEMKVHTHVIGFINGKNLLNQTNEPWQGYAGTGIYFEIGLRGNW